MNSQVRLLLLTFIVLIPIKVFGEEGSGSQPEIDPAVLSGQGSGVLPEVSEGSVAGVVINSSNAVKFKDMIIPELYPLVRADLLELDSARELHFRPGMDEGWNKAGEGAAQDDLLENGWLKEGVRPSRSFVFGDPAALENDPDKSRAAYKVLWNMQSALWGHKLIDSEFVISWFGDNKITRQAGGRWTRIYPAALNPEDKSIQLFREKVAFAVPPVIKGFSWLTFRFFGNEEDMLWLYSPAIGKVRQLTGSNRTDPFIKSSFSPDDIALWSGKAELVDPVQSRVVTALVPFPDYEPGVLKASAAGCTGLAEEAPAAGRAKWNFESRRFPKAYGWLPTSAVFIPRRMWRLELVPKDPYSTYGRQVLYVDAELMLPYYKFVYNRSGFLWKFMFTAYKQGSDAGKTVTAFFPQYIVIDDREKKEANIVEFSRTIYCDSYTDSVKIADFDPQAIAPARPAAQVPQK